MAYTDLETNAWIRRYHPVGDSRSRLVCFPHAGGSASYFHPVSARFSPGVDVIALQYPGRQDRRREPCVRDIGVLADRITEQLLRLSDKPTAFFGHSMGATLAFEVAWRLERMGTGAPRRVIASGRRAPAIIRRENMYERDDEGILAELRVLNGTDSALLDDEEILRIALPAIRGDYQAIESYVCPPGRAIASPITVLTGDSDPQTTLEEAHAWCHHTTGSLRIKIFPGGHFYLTANAAAVSAEIAADLDLLTQEPAPT